MGAGDEQGAAGSDERFVEVRRVHRHVGAVFPVEDQREGVAVLEAEQDQRGEPFPVGADMGNVAALARQGFGQKPPHVVVPDAREHGRFQPEARAAEGDVPRGAAEVFGEARNVLQPCADLLGVEVHGEPAQADDVQGAVGRENGRVVHGKRRTDGKEVPTKHTKHTKSRGKTKGRGKGSAGLFCLLLLFGCFGCFVGIIWSEVG